MCKKDLTTLTDAMAAWTGWKTEMAPRRDDQAFTNRFGREQAAKWLPVLHSMEDDFYKSDARHVAADLQEMAEMSSRRFREEHPEVEEDVIQALTWCYTFDFK